MKINLPKLIIIFIPIFVVVSTAFAFSAGQETDFNAVDTYIEREMEKWNLPGIALAIVQDVETAYLQGYGAAGPGGKPMTAQTPMIVASLSKSFTAMAVIQLAENGQINLDDPVITYLPWFHLADEEASAQITVRQLLNQNSGIAGISGMDTFFREDDSDNAIKNSVQILSDEELLYPVGETYEYSNANYHILGAVVEEVSGQPFADYIQQNILDPLEMTGCYTSRYEAMHNGMSTGYSRWWFKMSVAKAAPYNPGNLPAGGVICDAESMAHYMIAYLNQGQYKDVSILSPQGIAQMHTPAVPNGEGDDTYYGMGWIVGSVNGVDAVYHSGDAPTYQTAVLMVPEEGLGIVLIANTNNITFLYITRTMATDIYNILHGKSAVGFEQDSFIKMIYLTILGPFALAVIWTGWSIPRTFRRWKQGTRPPRDIVAVLWRIVLPLILDLFFIIYYLVMTPMLWGFPLKAYPIMYPNIWTVMLVSAILGSLGVLTRLIQIWKSKDF